MFDSGEIEAKSENDSSFETDSSMDAYHSGSETVKGPCIHVPKHSDIIEKNIFNSSLGIKMTLNQKRKLDQILGDKNDIQSIIKNIEIKINQDKKVSQ